MKIVVIEAGGMELQQGHWCELPATESDLAVAQAPMTGANELWNSFFAKASALSGKEDIAMIPAVIERGAGIDVGKAVLPV